MAEEGPAALLTGMGPTIVGYGAEGAFKFGAYEALKPVAVGALIGANLVVSAPVKAVQLIVGVALIIAAILFAASNLGIMPTGGTASALPLPLLILAIIVHFVLGILMAFGIGLYAPSLILLSLLGLDPRLAFPIMTSCCAFLMPATAIRFTMSDRVSFPVVIGIAIGGIPAVLAAAFIVKSLPMVWLRWGVVVVVLYAAFLLIQAVLSPTKKTEE